MICVMWFHPAVWIARKRLNLLREFRSDEHVISSGQISGTRYAERLVGLIEAKSKSPLLSAVGLQSSALSRRVNHILSKEGTGMKAKKYHHLLVVCFGLLLLPLSIGGIELENTLVDSTTLQPEKPQEIEFFQLAKEVKPVRINSVTPVYPEDAMRQKLQGKVFVRFRIGTDGRVDSARVLKGTPVFHVAALEAVRRFEFEPPKSNGEPISVWIAQAIRFFLDTGSDPDKVNRQPALMELWVNASNELLLDRKDEISLDQAVLELQERLGKSGFRKAMLRSVADHPGVAENIRQSSVHSVAIRAEQNVDGKFLHDLIQRLRQEKVELRITIL
jgi:TonB family protein